MKPTTTCRAALLLAALSPQAIGQEQTPVQPPEGFTALFNGKNLDGWWGMSTEDPRKLFAMSKQQLAAEIAKSLPNIRQHWRAENGVLINDGKGLFLTTKKNFGDFELLVDYKTVAKADSGIYLRGIPQVQIWDYTKEGGKWNLGADKGSGGLWNNSKGAKGKDPLVLADKPFGEWNRFRIKMVGSYVTVHLNGKLVVEDAKLENYFARKQPVPKIGPIQLQTHGGEIQWRNVYIREIAADEANAYLAKLDGEGFETVFNGTDFAGWKGPTNNYEVVDGGVLRCKPRKGGTIYTEASYTDFVATLEIKLPPGGNNGIAIRYPGSGDTAYVGMCELQVLDNTAKKYARLDPRQYHGSAYGMTPARRGFLRKTGEWNYERITVTGSRIVVELNGFQILDTDLSKVKAFMANHPHPGMTRTEGHFGFAGHNDPVEFRNVRIKSLAKR